MITTQQEYDDFFRKRRSKKKRRRSSGGSRPSAKKRGYFINRKRPATTKGVSARSSSSSKPKAKAQSVTSTSATKGRAVTKQWVTPFPLGKEVKTTQPSTAQKQPVVLKPPKTVAPIKPVQPKAAPPKKTGPIGNILKSNPSLKPTLGKTKSKQTPKSPKASTVAVKAIEKPMPPSEGPTSKPSTAEPKNEIENTAANEDDGNPQLFKKAMKVVGIVLGGTVNLGGIAFVMHTQYQKKQ
ncbi:MAG: hypothetical protein AAFO69_03450 [Bacteroidota bacterium]